MNGSRIRPMMAAAAMMYIIERSQSRAYSHACRQLPVTPSPTSGTMDSMASNIRISL